MARRVPPRCPMGSWEVVSILADSQMLRVIIDEPNSGTWNMAIDEALLHSACDRPEQTTLRFYQWSQATLSLGYFQRFADRSMHHSSQRCHLVRRSTGGGAIIHDDELTYSITAPLRSSLSRQTTAFYDLMHESLVEALATVDVFCERWIRVTKVAREKEPFLHDHGGFLAKNCAMAR